jgi:RimJ/RimL family protein N-acetyltransferase
MSAALPAIDPRPLTLEGEVVRLSPIDERHTDALFAAGADPEIWRHMTTPPWRQREDAAGYVAEARRAMAAGEEIVFAIESRRLDTAIGSTRYLDLRRADRALEIGATWIAPAFQRSAVNTESKLLLLTHAFEALGAWRVQLKCDARNLRSQRAIERLGAQREGVLRRHKLLPDGFVRDTVYYSILDHEWPAVKARLEGFLRC